MSKTFTFSVMRTSYAWCDIEIKANSEAEAKATVLDICGDYEYSEKDAEYRIEQVSSEGTTA